jgi:transcriptional regulator with XRE-family HTH domain
MTYGTSDGRSTIGTRIRRRRRELLLTQGELAARVGVAQVTVAHWENGRTLAALANRAALAAALDTPIPELFAGEDDAPVEVGS